ncbi:MAG: M24 family metallopeptidase [Phycisphaerales bacterium]
MPATAAPPRRSRAVAGPDFPDRVRRLLTLAATSKPAVEHLLITNPSDVAYLTGFLGGDSYLLVSAPGAGGSEKASRPIIISDFRYQEELEPLKPFCRVHIRSGAMTEAVGAVLAERRIKELGLQAEHMTLAGRKMLAQAARSVRLVETVGLVSSLRAVKDASEVAHLRAAIRIQEAALKATLPAITRALARNAGRGSISEAEIAAVLESEMKTRGSSKPSFETIVAARAKGSLPHYRPGSVTLTRNQPLLVDWGAIHAGYHGDMTRVFCWGRWPARLRDAYTIVLEAHDLAAQALRAGALTTDVDAAARDHIKAAGLGDYFGHGVGHGIGLDIHEDPRVSHMARATPLVAGNVVTIEPGVYLPGVGGIRLENDYLVTEKGSENLCTLPLSLDWATR